MNFEAPNKQSPICTLFWAQLLCVSVHMPKRQVDKNIKGWTNDGGFGTDSILMVQCTSLHIINAFIMSYQWQKASGKINFNQCSVAATDLNPPQLCMRKHIIWVSSSISLKYFYFSIIFPHHFNSFSLRMYLYVN